MDYCWWLKLEELWKNTLYEIFHLMIIINSSRNLVGNVLQAFQQLGKSGKRGKYAVKVRKINKYFVKENLCFCQKSL